MLLFTFTKKKMFKIFIHFYKTTYLMLYNTLRMLFYSFGRYTPGIFK